MSEMGRCRDCRHWYPPGVGWTPDPQDAEKGNCGLLKGGNGYPDLVALDWCGCCEAALLTHPDFGCVQFEAKS